MFAALLYKEYREHRSIWLALAVVGVGVSFGIPLLYQPEPGQVPLFHEMLAISVVILAWTYGVVCGAMLLAGEREGGTQTFLDMLPTSRLPLWLAKCVIGGLLVYLQVALLAAQMLVQGFYPSGHPVACVLALLVAGLVGFTWGLMFSALARNVLNAIGMAILCQIVVLPICATVGAFVLAVMAGLIGYSFVWEDVLIYISGVLILAVPLPVSALFYSGVDRSRRPVRLQVVHDVSGWWSASSAVRWLAWRQLRGVFLGLLIFSLLAGLAVIGKGLVTWPVLTLGMGAFCGIAVFLDEQSGAYRFLGEQRFPLGTIWRVKVGILFFAVLLFSLVMLLPAILVQLFSQIDHPSPRPWDTFLERTFGTSLMGATIPVGLFLFVWPIYGFAMGCVCGLLFRKPLVAMVAAFGLGVLVSGAWAPSLLLGGLHLWQLAGVPIVLLGCARLLMHVWATDRLVSRTTACCLAVTVVLCGGLIAGGLWYRVIEIPNTPEPADFPTFVASLPTPEENEAGRLIRGGCGRLDNLRQAWEGQEPRMPLGPHDIRRGVPANKDLLGRFSGVLVLGWPDENDDRGAWLDRAFEADWWKPFAEASRKPTGVVEDPRDFTVHGPSRTLVPARLAAVLFAARGLQIQKMKGDPAVFVDHLAISLAIVRNLQNHGPSLAALFAHNIETGQIDALTRWLEQLDDRPELLALAAEALHKHWDWLPADYHDQDLADYLIGVNILETPEMWHGDTSRLGAGLSDAALFQLGWNMPCEELRLRRLLCTLHWGDSTARAALPRESLRIIPWSSGSRALEQGLARRLVQVAAAELTVAAAALPGGDRPARRAAGATGADVPRAHSGGPL